MIKRKELIEFFSVGILLCFIPLIGHVHFESASVVTLFSCLYFIVSPNTETRFLSYRFLLPYIVFIPLFIKELLFGCLSFDGIAFWIVLPIPSLLLVHSIRNLTRTYSQFDRLISIGLFLCIALIAPIIELKQSPIVYLYNSLWGFWPGPIYDEEVRFPFQLLIHRFYVLIWAALIWELGRKQLEFKRIGITFLAVASLFLSFRALGIIRTTADIARSFSDNKTIGQITLYYNSNFIDTAQADFYLKELNYHFNDLQHLLQTSISEPVLVFLYDDPWQKKELVGAKFTQYTPVWLSSYQVHIDRTSFESVVRHEMVHLVSKSLVTNPLGANWNIGITEGLATAFDPDISSKSTLHEFVAAGGIPKESSMKSLFSFIGFYTQSSYNAYYKSGSFIQFLAQTKPISPLMNWYAGATFESVYDAPIDSSIKEWQAFLRTQEVDSSQIRQSEQTFAQPSLFEVSCPRMIKPEYKTWDFARKALARKDRATYSSLLKKGTQTEDINWKNTFSFYYAYDLANRSEVDSSLSILLQLPESAATNRLLYDVALMTNNTAIQDILKDKISTYHKLFTEKSVDDYLKLRYKRELPLQPNPILLPLIFEVLQEKDFPIEDDYLERILSDHQIDFTFIKSYLNGAKWMVKQGFKEEAITFLKQLELKSTAKQHRYLIQRTILLLDNF